MPGKMQATRSRPLHGVGVCALIVAATIAIALSGFTQALSAPAAPAAPAKKDEGLQTSAPAAVLLDADSDSILYEKNGDQLVAPASLAKLMTLEFLFHEIKEGRVKLDDEYIIS